MKQLLMRCGQSQNLLCTTPCAATAGTLNLEDMVSIGATPASCYI